MKLNEIETVIDSLLRTGGRFLVVGGVAVVAHGYERMTRDLDLVLALESDELSSLSAIFEKLQQLGYRPMPAVELHALADLEVRSSWIRDKNMVVLNLVSDQFPSVPIDIFVESPFDFEAAWADAEWVNLSSSITFPVVSKKRLIEMKRAAGRPQDLADIEKLEQSDYLGGR